MTTNDIRDVGHLCSGCRACVALCPVSAIRMEPDGEGFLRPVIEEKMCLECGLCYSFPSAEAVYENPEKLLPSHPGFRYKYLVDAAEKVAMKEIVFDEIIEKASYDFTVSELMKVKGISSKNAADIIEYFKRG